jgi:NAD(P)-dependent dehydrogenase (short-subunit alcohol dehydrogenase family)
MLALALFAIVTLCISQTSAQFEFNVSDVLDKINNNNNNNTKRDSVDDTIQNVGPRLKRQTAPVPCGGHNTYPPVAICMPPTIMTEDDSAASGVGKRVVITGGSRGIANPLAITRKAQGASVTCTSREWNPNVRAVRQLPPLETPLTNGIIKEEMDLGLDFTASPKAPARFVRRDMARNNYTLPDELYLVANNADSGNPEDYSDTEREYMLRVHFSGWHTLIMTYGKYRKLPQNANRTMTVTFMTSGGAWAITPGVLEYYYGGHKMKRDFVLHQNNKQLMKPSVNAPQNFIFSVMYGFFINTTYWKYIRNPSADEGDKFQKQYMNVTRDFTLTYGNSPQGTANALIRIGSGQMGSLQRHFVLPPRALPPPAAFIDWTAGSFRTLENNFGDPLLTQAQIGGWAALGAQVNQHGSYELPAYESAGDDW